MMGLVLGLRFEVLLQESRRLHDVYQNMEKQFLEDGLNPSAIEEIRHGYQGFEDGVAIEPLDYKDMVGHLPSGSVRLLVVPLSEFKALNKAMRQLTEAVISVLPSGTKVYCNPRELYHITLFHFSRHEDPRPITTDVNGGCDLAKPPGERNPPSASALHNESKVIQSIVTCLTPPQLVVRSAFMADSGTLLLTWTDPSGSIFSLRQTLRTSLPGSPTKQTNIIHSSLCRILTPQSLDQDTVRKVSEVCREWSVKWCGRDFIPKRTWLVYEDKFSIILGRRITIPYKQTSSTR